MPRLAENNDDRCCMGGPLGDDFRCLNEALPLPALWCAECQRGIDGGPPCCCDNCVKEFNEATA
jgi:hypothetical protein